MPMNETLLQGFGQRVRTSRRARDWTQRYLAGQSGVHHLTISRIEHGCGTKIYAETICALAQALDVTTDYLLGLPGKKEGAACL